MATPKKKVSGRKKGAVVPRALPAVAAKKRLPQKAKATAAKAKQTAQEIADTQVKLSHVGAGVAGAGISMFTSSWLADSEWLDWISPEWQSVVLTGLGTTGSYFAYRYDKPHLAWGLGGWAAGSAYFGCISALSRNEYEKEVKQLASANTAQLSKPRNGPDDEEDYDADDYERDRETERIELAEERVHELEEELAAARARLTPEVELIAA